MGRRRGKPLGAVFRAGGTLDDPGRARGRGQSYNGSDDSSSSDEGGGGYLVIGGMRVRAAAAGAFDEPVQRSNANGSGGGPSGGGNGGARSRGRGGRGRGGRGGAGGRGRGGSYALDIGSDDLDSDLMDYLENVAAAEEEDEDEGEGEADGSEEGAAAGEGEGAGNAGAATAAARMAAALRRFGRRSLEGALEGTLAHDLESDGGSSDGDEAAEAAAAARLEALRAAFDPGAVAPGEALLVDSEGRPVAALGQLDPQQRYPVQATPVWRGGGGGERAAAARAAAVAAAMAAAGSPGGRRAKQRSVVKGANGGKLLPGEKARLRREKIDAKRTARAAKGDGGFDAAAVAEELAGFVSEGRDMAALDPMGKHGLGITRALAGCFGLRAGVQGSGSRRFMVVWSTPRSCLPTGDTAARLEAILAKERERLRLGTAALAAELPGASGDGGGRSRSAPRRRGSRGGGTPEGGGEGRRFLQPVAFVSRGAVDPNTAPTEVHPPLQQQQQQSDVDQPWEGEEDEMEEEEEEEEEEEWDSEGDSEEGMAEDLQPQAAEAARVGRFIASLLLSDEDEEGAEEEEEEEEEEREQEPAAEAAAAPAGDDGGDVIAAPWFEDLQPQHYGLGFHPAAGGGEEEGEQQEEETRNGGGDAPLYERAAVGLGLGLGSGEAEGGASGSGGKQRKGKGKAARRGGGGGSAAVAAAVFEDPFGLNEPGEGPSSSSRGAGRGSRGGAPLADAAALLAASPYGVTKQQLSRAAKKVAKDARRAARRQQGGGEYDAGGIGGGFGFVPPAGPTVAAGVQFAAFEAHTTGIGSKLMRNMGWTEGGGLGRARQGRAEPLAAEMRPKKQGLGFG